MSGGELTVPKVACGIPCDKKLEMFLEKIQGTSVGIEIPVN